MASAGERPALGTGTGLHDIFLKRFMNYRGAKWIFWQMARLTLHMAKIIRMVITLLPTLSQTLIARWKRCKITSSKEGKYFSI